ncbi:TPA: hypothetical protein HA241_03325 [Candidatus Woesearchaeota archaeon]|nr:hypothetical protein [Candidatus Woesearchaeota archaeon]
MRFSIEDFLLDTLYACLHYPFGLQRPAVVRGYFADTSEGMYQRILFEELCVLGFRRTSFQMIFPDQTAGLVRAEHDSDLETHIRFYSDGVIAAEVEHGRMSLGHWRGERYSSTKIVDTILDTELNYLPSDVREGIRNQFAVRDYDCLRSHDSEANKWSIRRALKIAAGASVVTVQYPFTILGAV